MTPSRRRLLLLTMVATPSLALAQPQPWPTRAVRIIVPFPGGAGTDTLARAYAHRLSEIWGQPVVVENRAGAVATNWFLMAAPAGMDPGIAARVNEVLQQGLNDPTVKERLEGIGVISLGNPSPAEIAAFVASEADRWGPVVRAAGVQPS